MTDPPAATTVERTYEDIVEDLVRLLQQAGALPHHGASVPWGAFLRLSTLVHEHFEVPGTTFTPVMRRLLFALGFAARSSHLVGVGTYVGYTFSWLLGDRSDHRRSPFFDTALGIDTSAQANAIARRNCAILGHGHRLSFTDGDGVAVVAGLESPIDLLYLDLDDPRSGKAGYRHVLAAAISRFRSGTLVLAHDPCVPAFAHDFEAYHDFVRGCGLFSGCWILPVDGCGLSVAVAR
jgi:predicted O-methyltransferase YrrM